jgi:tetratricopeptide (TPR) repeat protein
MRVFEVFLALLIGLIAGLSTVMPAQATTSEEAVSDPAPPHSAAAATVLEHTLEVYIDNGRRLRLTQTWVVRIDDPAASSAGLPAPEGLDGTSDGDARVLGDLLVVPPGAAAGDVFTLKSVGRQRRGPYSGVFATAPDLPVEHASVVIRSPTWVSITAWPDPRAEPTYTSTRSRRTAEFTWDRIAQDAPAQLIWTTWESWDEAGVAITKHVDRLLADKQKLGRGLAADVEGLSIPELVDRVNQRIQVYPEDYGSWEGARPAAEVLVEGEGTAADRAVVLLSILEVAGHDARPAAFRPAALTAAGPLTVPAPAQFTRPAVAVITPKGTVWIDPASPYTAIPDIPASMAGAVAWAPERLPVHLAAHGAMDGMVSVNAQIRIDQEGAATWTATISASGTALEWIRTRLAPLEPAGRATTLHQLVQQGRPELHRFQMTDTGVEDPKRQLKLTLQGYEEHAVSDLGPGMNGTIAPLVAPGLAGWLPTRILIHEEVAVEAPPGMQPVAMVPAEPTFHHEVVLSRSLRREGSRLVLLTEALRPLRDDSPARAAEASRFLEEKAAVGPRILYFGLPSPRLAKAVRADERFGSVAERWTVEALIWLSVDDRVRARKTFKKALTRVSATDLAVQIRRYSAPGDPRPWLVLHDASKEEAVWIEAVEGLGESLERREAWLRAVALSTSEDPMIRTRALRVMYRVQPEDRPNERIDGSGYEAWQPRAEIFTLAEEAARAASGTELGVDVPILLHKAQRDLERGRTEEALALVDRILGVRDEPAALVLRAEARAQLGVAAEDLVAEIDGAVRRAPFNADVLGQAAHAMAAVGRPSTTLAYGLSAARLAFTDSHRWHQATGYALAAGDLETAAYTARRASDLDPESRDAAASLRLVATLVRDSEGASLGATRSGERISRQSPESVPDLLGIVPPEALLALLQHHEEEVASNGRLLGMRAQLRLDADLLDDAARDGVILATHHGDPRGLALSFAGTAGRLWSPGVLEGLKPYQRNEQVRATRLEYALFSRNGDPLADARVLADDPRARVLTELVANPDEFAASQEGWPEGLADLRPRTPSGYRDNQVLGACKGVRAWSHRDQATTLLLLSQPVEGLPPPLAQLYTPRVPDVASLPEGGRVIRLDGGLIPLYAAVAPHGERQVYGLGFTAEAARRALTTAREAWPIESLE